MKIIVSEITYLLPPFSTSNTWQQLLNISVINSFFLTILQSVFQFEGDVLTSSTLLIFWFSLTYDEIPHSFWFIYINCILLLLFFLFFSSWVGFLVKFPIIMYHIFACELLFIISESLRSASSIEWTLGQPEKHRETLSLERKYYSPSCKFLEF